MSDLTLTLTLTLTCSVTKIAFIVEASFIWFSSTPLNSFWIFIT